MKKLIMWNLMTLDGFFEGSKSWDIDWHDEAWGEELERFSLEQLGTAGMLIFGRVTYQGMASYWASAKGKAAEGKTAELMNSIPKLVFSRTLEKADWNNTRLVRSDAVRAITELKADEGKDMFIFGSAALSSSLAQNGLIDEYRICIAPLVLGGGNPLFKPSGKIRMKLLEARTLASGGVILRYSPV